VRAATVILLGSLLTLGFGGCGRSALSLESGGPNLVPHWAEQEGFAGNQRAVEGARIFAESGCLTCHTYLGAGSQNVGARDLSAIGSTPRTEAAFASYVADPSKYGNDVMPHFKGLGRTNLMKLGAFLVASKGRR
jgi:mono/diheme cytochrome c family protein